MGGPFLGLNILISWPKTHHVVEHEVLVMQFADFLLGLLAFFELMKSLKVKHCGMANEQAYPLCYFESSFFSLIYGHQYFTEHTIWFVLFLKSSCSITHASLSFNKRGCAMTVQFH